MRVYLRKKDSSGLLLCHLPRGFSGGGWWAQDTACDETLIFTSEFALNMALYRLGDGVNLSTEWEPVDVDAYEEPERTHTSCVGSHGWSIRTPLAG